MNFIYGDRSIHGMGMFQEPESPAQSHRLGATAKAGGRNWIVVKAWQLKDHGRHVATGTAHVATGKAPPLLTPPQAMAQIPTVLGRKRLTLMTPLQRARAMYGKAVQPLTLVQAKALIGRPFVALAGQAWMDDDGPGQSRHLQAFSIDSVDMTPPGGPEVHILSNGQYFNAHVTGGKVVTGTGSDPVFVFRAAKPKSKSKSKSKK